MEKKLNVLTIHDDNIAWEKRAWGVEHLPVIQSESMEMHKKRVLPHSIGIPHIHHYETLYYVLEGEIISLSGEDLQNTAIQTAGSYVHIPQGLLHTVANATDESAYTIVSHNMHDIENKCTTFYDKEQLAKDRDSANSANRLIPDYSSSINFTDQQDTKTKQNASDLKKKQEPSPPQVSN